MSIYVRKYTASNRPAILDYVNPATDSSARKFNSSDVIKNNDPTFATSNVEHIINTASGIRALGIAASALAIQARADIAASLDVILNTDAAKDIKPAPVVHYTEEDVNTIQKNIANTAASRISMTNADPIIAKQVAEQTKNFVSDSRHAVIPNKSENQKVKTTNLIVPTIEHAQVDLDHQKGTTDAFYTTLSFTLPMNQIGNVKMIRIFRAEVDSPNFTRPLSQLSPVGVQRISSVRANTSNVYFQLHDAGVNTGANEINPFTGAQQGSTPDGRLIVPPSLGPAPLRVADPTVPPALQHVDKSVLDDINTLSNLQNNPAFGYSTDVSVAGVQVGGSVETGQDIGRAQKSQLEAGMSVLDVTVEGNNSLQFTEIACVSPDALVWQQVGDVGEFLFVDDTISYGRGFKYFVTTIDKNMIQSARSAMVDVVVEALRVPPRPSLVTATVEQKTIALSMIVNDQLVEKYEIYKFDPNPNRKTTVVAEQVFGISGFTVQETINKLQQNKYILIGETMHGPLAGGVFIDKDVQPGITYTYRVYTVDIFGNKSESPYELQAYVTDREQNFVPLKTPSILTEVDSTTGKIKVTFSIDEPVVERLRLERMDLTIGEQEYSIPSAPSRIILGSGRNPRKNRPSMSGELQFNSDLSETWNGFFINTGKTHVFVDQSAMYDHIYQYRIYGEDRYGNKTGFAISPPLLVNRRPFINAPTALSATLITNETGVQGIQLRWTAGSLDVSAADQTGNQTSLENSSVRTLYQVQRKREGESVWYNFPLISNTFVLDSMKGVNGDFAPNYRPEFPELNSTYSYRVQAIQIGDYISNFTQQVTIFAGLPMAAPDNFVLRASSVFAFPFYVMLNWDTRTLSGVVDKWEIQRAEINNFAAGTMSTSDPEVFKNINYQPFREVYREASRFTANSIDRRVSSREDVNSSIITGQHYYMDSQVEMGNTYFYRMRSVSPDGVVSGWTYRAIRLASQAYNQIWLPLYTDSEKRQLALSMIPQRLTKGIRKLPPSSGRLQPGYSAPPSFRNEPMIDIKFVG